jgi:hypothetical protein
MLKKSLEYNQSSVNVSQLVITYKFEILMIITSCCLHQVSYSLQCNQSEHRWCLYIEYSKCFNSAQHYLKVGGSEKRMIFCKCSWFWTFVSWSRKYKILAKYFVQELILSLQCYASQGDPLLLNGGICIRFLYEIKNNISMIAWSIGGSTYGMEINLSSWRTILKNLDGMGMLEYKISTTNYTFTSQFQASNHWYIIYTYHLCSITWFPWYTKFF